MLVRPRVVAMLVAGSYFDLRIFLLTRVKKCEQLYPGASIYNVYIPFCCLIQNNTICLQTHANCKNIYV